MTPRRSVIALTRALMSLSALLIAVLALGGGLAGVGHAPAPRAESAPIAPAAPAVRAPSDEHQVRRGETIWLFERCRKARPGEIARLNRERFPTRSSLRSIFAGERLTLPPVPSQITIWEGLIPDHGPRPARARAALRLLAGCLDTTERELVAANGLSAREIARLHVGQRLDVRRAPILPPEPSPLPTVTPTPTPSGPPRVEPTAPPLLPLVAAAAATALAAAAVLRHRSTRRRRDPERVRRPRWWVLPIVRGMALSNVIGVVVALNGATEPTQGARNPEIQQTLGSGDAGFSISLGTLSLGMLATSFLSGHLVDRWGTRKVLAFGAWFCWLTFTGVGFVFDHGVIGLPVVEKVSLGLLLAQLFIGVGFALLDAALYRISTALEREQIEQGSGRRENQKVHVFYAAGSILGAATSYLAVKLGFAISWHLAAVGLGALTVAMLLALPRLPDLRGEPSASLSRETLPELRRVAVVGAAAGFAVIVGFNWASVLLDRLGASEAVAASGVIAFSVGAAVGRLVVYRFSADRDPVWVVRLAGLGTFPALALIAGSGRVSPTIAGLVLLGLALGPVTPLVQSAAAMLSKGAEGRGVVLTQRYGYIGFVAAYYVVGPLSQWFGDTDSARPLQIALGFLVVFPIAMIVLAGSVRAARARA